MAVSTESTWRQPMRANRIICAVLAGLTYLSWATPTPEFFRRVDNAPIEPISYNVLAPVKTGSAVLRSSASKRSRPPGEPEDSGDDTERLLLVRDYLLHRIHRMAVDANVPLLERLAMIEDWTRPWDTAIERQRFLDLEGGDPVPPRDA